MGADVNFHIDRMISDAEKKIRTDLARISSKVKMDFISRAQEAVLLYYSHYPKPPRVYERTNNLRDNVVDSDFTFRTLNGNSYGAWVQFNSNHMQEYDVGNKDAVVVNFMYGIHGRRSIFVEDNPAINLMRDFQTNYKTTLDKYFINLGYTVK